MTYTMMLAGKVGVVTGAATGIGRAIATRFAGEGATVVIDYVGPSDGAEQFAASLGATGATAAAIAADVGDPAQVAALFDETVRRFGRLDILVNNAGIEKKIPFVDIPLADWDAILRVNLTGTFLCAQRAAQQMIAQGGGGRIINISSVHEDVPMTLNAAYSASKGGIRMLMRTIAAELAPHGILVNNIAPGAVFTPIDADVEVDKEKLAALLAEIPLGRMAKPEEIAALCAFLASDQASYSTGATFFIDGGMSQKGGSL
jgi:glucose 1-dehydrogenase